MRTRRAAPPVPVRKNQRHLTRAERRRFVEAVLELKRRGEYDEFVRMHAEFSVTDAEYRPRPAHMTPSFFPWHRVYLIEFERSLQRIDPAVTVPYWDWTTDNTPAAALWGDDFLGGDGRLGDRQVMDGPFAHRHGNWRITSGIIDGRYLTRSFGRFGLPTKEDVDRALQEPVYDTAPWNSTSRTGFRNHIEGWSAGGPQRWRNHNRVHRWIGGSMVGVTSPNDPVFWLHHSFIDLLWNRWQRAHPKAGYLPREPLPRSDPQHGRVFAFDEPMPPWGARPSELMDHRGLYRYA
ncbi:tyrosinase family protein [Streptomyces sp. NPDC057638]|uniref:tyrosinase family protein n=1 Tax=Streptomyces sp. NPDC057638 TaxID=3346190 RepID=UPI00367AFA2F